MRFGDEEVKYGNVKSENLSAQPLACRCSIAVLHACEDAAGR
jgi:hypothetical protein